MFFYALEHSIIHIYNLHTLHNVKAFSLIYKSNARTISKADTLFLNQP